MEVVEQSALGVAAPLSVVEEPPSRLARLSAAIAAHSSLEAAAVRFVPAGAAPVA